MIVATFEDSKTSMKIKYRLKNRKREDLQKMLRQNGKHRSQIMTALDKKERKLQRLHGKNSIVAKLGL
jgi:hypothetical protein